MSEEVHLTAREIDVAKLIAEGLSNKRIGAELGISDHTAKYHAANVMKKLRAPNRTRAAVIFDRTRRGQDAAP